MFRREGFYEREERRIIREDIARHHRYAKHRDMIERERRIDRRNDNRAVRRQSNFSYKTVIKLCLVGCLGVEFLAGMGASIILATIITLIAVFYFTRGRR